MHGDFGFRIYAPADMQQHWRYCERYDLTHDGNAYASNGPG